MRINQKDSGVSQFSTTHKNVSSLVKGGLAVSVLAAAVMTGSASAATVSIGGDSTFLEQGMEPTLGDLFTISNTSDAGYQITSIVIDTSTSASGVIFDTVTGGPGNDDGQPFVADAVSAADTGFLSVSGDTDGSQQITLSFTDFDPGETFSFTVDLDDAALFVNGIDFAGSTLTAVFDGALIDPTTLTATYSGGHTSALATVSGEVTVVPVPAAVYLFGSGLLGLLGMSARRKK